MRWISLGLQRPLATLVAAAVLTVVLGAGVLRIGITADYRVFFSDDNPQLLAFLEQEALFYQSDTLVFAVGGDVFTPRTLAAIAWLTQHARNLPYVTRALSVTNYPQIEADGEALSAGPLAPDADASTPQAARALAEKVRQHEAIHGRLVAQDGQTALVVATVQLPGLDQQKEVPRTILPARELVVEFGERWPELEVHLFGIVPFNQTLAETTLRDLWVLFPFSLALMALALWWLLGGFVPALITGCVVLISTAIAMGLAGWTGMLLTTATAVAPVIILTLAIADSVHLITGYQEARAEGLSAAPAMERSLQLNLRAITLTSVSTVIGFLSMNFSDAPPFRELGNIVAVGVVVAWLASMFVLPALVLRYGGGPPRRMPSRRRWSLVGRAVGRRYRVILFGSLAVTLPIAALVPLNTINDVFREWFSMRDPVRAGIEFGIARMGGVEELHYTLDSGQPDGVVEPTFTAQVQAFSNWLRAQPEVVHASDHLHILKRMNRVLQDDLPEQYKLPDSADLGRQFLSVYEIAQPPGHSLNDLLDLDKRRLRLTVTMRPSTSSQLKAFDERARDWLARHGPDITTSQASGALMMFAELGQRNIRSLLLGAALALIAISAFLIVALKSAKYGVVSLVPNLLPAVVGFGIWGAVSGEINIAIAVVLGMTFGIVVDDTIHFLSRYQRARRDAGLDAVAAVEDAFAHVGRALWVTTAVLVGGFMVLALSDFRPTADMGLLTSIVLVVALVLDFLLLPALLIATDGSKTRGEGSNELRLAEEVDSSGGARRYLAGGRLGAGHLQHDPGGRGNGADRSR